MEVQWPLIIFTTFIAWSAGVFGTQGILALRKRACASQMTTLIVSFIILVIGGVAVMFHLARPLHIFNGFGHLSSGITQELIAVVIMGCAMVIYFALLRRGGKGMVAPWCAVLAPLTAVILVVVAGHSYMMAARPAWDSAMQIVSLLGAACLLGPATMAVVMKIRDDEDTHLLKLPVLVCSIVAAACSVAYMFVMGSASSSFTSLGYYYDPTQITRGMIDFEAVTGVFSSQHIGLSVGVIVCSLASVCVAVYLELRAGGARGKTAPEAATDGAEAVEPKGRLAGRGFTIACIAIVLLALAAAVLLRVLFYSLGLSVFMFYAQ